MVKFEKKIIKKKIMENNRKEIKWVVFISYFYLMVPFLIFAVGWMGKRYWIPIVPMLVFCYYKACKEAPKYWKPRFTKENIIKILFILLVICISKCGS